LYKNKKPQKYFAVFSIVGFSGKLTTTWSGGVKNLQIKEILL